ncbi:MAG: T9SS type A sorting domain-containing protein [Melioribacteraceae bacterium]
MKKHIQFFVFVVVVGLINFISISKFIDIKETHVEQKIRSSSSPKASVEMKKARWEYFDKMLRDPKTKKIPKGIRQKELSFAKELEIKNNSLSKTSLVNELGWQEAGPSNVGGRTRALAVDLTNSNTIIAGGASGGIWKSTDKGSTWTMKSTTSQILSVTSIAQDPRNGQTNTWYYSTGEFSGSAADGAFTHRFSGDGIYKSTDNGETWNHLPSTISNITKWDSQFDYISKVIISPSTGTVFLTSNGYGILRSTDGGNSFSIVIGGRGHHVYSDIDIASDGTLVSVISSPFNGFTPSKAPGVYKSSDDGQTWSSITPTTFPQTHFKSALAIAPSNTTVAYVVTNTGSIVDSVHEDIRFHKINISTGSSEDRSVNMPSFPGPFGGDERIKTQQNYNLVIAVKPNDENFVIIGATSLFRSTNGFTTKLNDSKIDWIGGYHQQNFFYPNFHPDIHSFFFEPNNSNAMWWGHDGGLSYTSDITNTSYSQFFPWENKNNGYNVTQFYHTSIPKEANDNRIMGGSQDNGTSFFLFDGSVGSRIRDVSSGDGSYSYFGNNYAFTSVQNGIIKRLKYDGQNHPNSNSGYSEIYPNGATNQWFINPFAVDPNDEDVMYYPADDALWRNNQLGSIPEFERGTSVGWTKLNDLTVPLGYKISALAISKSNPTHRLYYGGSDFNQQPSGTPKIFRLDNANTSTSGAVDISIAGIDAFSFLNSISVNPNNADELIAIFSNYNIVGIYHSTNAGQSFTPIEGNLEGNENNPGPSIRAAAIVPTNSGTQYFLATSTGVYSTTQLNGANTNWSLEGASTMGNVVVNSLATRKSDGRIVAGTHGRGAFVANTGTSGNGTAVATASVSTLSLQSNPGQSGSTSFELSNTGDAPLTYNVSVAGSFNTALSKVSSNNQFLNAVDFQSKKFLHNRTKHRLKNTKIGNPKSSKSTVFHTSLPSSITGDDILFLDDGDETSDTFVGWGDTSSFYWYNKFNVSGANFEMDSFAFFMRTEQANSNNIYAAIYDKDFTLLSEGNLSFALSEQGQWYSVNLNPALQFNDGETFYIEIESTNSIPYPAGTDEDAQSINNSFYYDGSVWKNLNTISGFENGAFLIRAIGTLDKGNGGGPVTVTPTSGTISPSGTQTITLSLDAQNLNEGTYSGQVSITTNGGNITIPIDYLVDVENISTLPTEFSLTQNYPNPFNPTTTIEFSLPQTSDVTLKIYDMLGKEVTTLVDKKKSGGTYRVSLDATKLSSGIYIYRLEADRFSSTRKMILIK